MAVTRFKPFGWFGLGVALLLMAGCTGQSSANPTSPATTVSPISSTSLPGVTSSGPGSSTIASSIASSPAPASPSITRSAPSTTTKPPTTTTHPTKTTARTTTSAIPTGPWPTTLNAAQVKEAQAAITAYRGYYVFLSEALAAPGKSWTAEAAKWSADPVKSNDLKYFTETAKLGQHTSGAPVIYPKVTKVQPALVTLTACVDTTNVGFFDKSGNSIKAPNQSGVVLAASVASTNCSIQGKRFEPFVARYLRHRRLHQVMLATIRRLSIVLILTVAVGGTIGVSVAGATGTGVGCGPLGCGAGAADDGNPSDPSDPSSGSSGNSGNSTPPPCSAVALSPQPEASSPWWNGHTAAEGVVVHWVCTDGSEPVSLVPFFQANGTVTPPPVDPAVLAQQAYKQIPTPTPVMHFGPDEAQVAVKVPVWLWVDRPALNPVTVTAGAVSVTATPEVTSVTWSMGGPGRPDDQSGPVAATSTGGVHR